MNVSGLVVTDWRRGNGLFGMDMSMVLGVWDTWVRLCFELRSNVLHYSDV
jgi:hypothetical protein